MLSEIALDQGLSLSSLFLKYSSFARRRTGIWRGGVELPVSSRAFGDYLAERRGDDQVVDPKNFLLETFDFVRNAGVSIAVPRFIESFPDLVTPNHQEPALTRSTPKTNGSLRSPQAPHHQRLVNHRPLGMVTDGV